MRHSTPTLSKTIRDLAREAYQENGYLRAEYRDEHSLGVYRSVLLRDGVAIKFARIDDHAHMNREEWASWLRMPEMLRAVMAKPLAISNCGRVMAVELIPKTLAQHYPYAMKLLDFNKKLRKLLENSELFTSKEIALMMCDNHANNIGVRDNGELCWIDYAGE